MQHVQEAYARAVRIWRLKLGWTQVEAANWYGCGVRQWRRWECNEARVPLPLIKRMAEYTRLCKRIADLESAQPSTQSYLDTLQTTP